MRTRAENEENRRARAGRHALPAALAAILALVATTAATAGGTTSISSAPTIQPGASESANTLTDQTSSDDTGNGGCWTDHEYWKLPLTAGDQVVIKVDQISPSYNTELGVFPAGTTDANIRTASAVVSQLVVKGSISFTAFTTGTYPVVVGPNCYDGADGPFTFTVAVSHHALPEALVTFPALQRVSAHGNVTATVKLADGTPINDKQLVLKLYGTWKDKASGPAKPHLLATASAKHGSVRFSFHLPAALGGGTVSLKVAGNGPGYQPVSSAALNVSVA
jgi:hypothetical protein